MAVCRFLALCVFVLILHVARWSLTLSSDLFRLPMIKITLLVSFVCILLLATISLHKLITMTIAAASFIMVCFIALNIRQ